MNDDVLYELDAGVAEITLNRPTRRNAINAGMRDRLAEIVNVVRNDDSVRCVILRGNGGSFCSGGDISSIQDDKDAASKRRRLIAVQATVTALIQLDRPVIAVVEGAAFGAGLGLALAADFILAAPNARFACSFMRIGLVPDFGVFYLLPRVAGLQRAKDLIYTGREFNSAEALAMGIVYEVHETPSLLERAREMARRFANAPPVAMSLSKRALSRSLESDLSTMLAIEADAQGIAFSTDYAKEALQRFLEKQPPVYTWS
ncbi:MAG: enoyl-CoA hydratase/isomerase family protein [Pseudomonadota bacterium]